MQSRAEEGRQQDFELTDRDGPRPQSQSQTSNSNRSRPTAHPRLAQALFITGVVLALAGSIGHFVSLVRTDWQTDVYHHHHFGLFRYCDPYHCYALEDGLSFAAKEIWTKHSDSIMGVRAFGILAMITALTGSCLALATLLPKRMRYFMKKWNRKTPYVCLPLSTLCYIIAVGVDRSSDLDEDLRHHGYYFGPSVSFFVFIGSGVLIIIGEMVMHKFKGSLDDDDDD